MTFKLLPIAHALTLATLGSTFAHAAEPAIVMGEVRVSAQRDAGALRSSRVLTSVDVLGADKIEDKNVTNSWELVGQLPGVQCQQRQPALHRHDLPARGRLYRSGTRHE
jgi:iron complex outermembrane receptor protein